MIIKKEFFLLALVTVFSSAILRCSESPSLADERSDGEKKGAKEELYEARKTYYQAQANAQTAKANLNERINSHRTHAEKEIISKGIDAGANIIIKGSYLLRKRVGFLTDDEQTQEDLNLVIFESQKLEKDLRESSIATKKSEQALLESQKLNSDIEAAIRLCQNKPSTDKKCGELIDNFFKQLEEQSKK